MSRSIGLLIVFATLVSCLRAADTEIPRLVLPAPHGDSAYLMTAMPDSQLALTGTSKGQIKLWDVAKGIELRTVSLGLQGDKRLIALLVRHATQIYVVTSDQVMITEIPSFKVINTIECKADIHQASVSNDGESLWLGSSTPQKNLIFSIRRGRFPLRQLMERTRPDNSVRSWGAPEVSPDGRYAIIADSNKSPSVVVRVKDGQTVHTLPTGTRKPNGEESSSHAWSSESRIISSRGMGPDGKTNLIEFTDPDTLQVEWSTEMRNDTVFGHYSASSNIRAATSQAFLGQGGKFFFLDDRKIDGPYSLPGFYVGEITPVDSRFALCTVTENGVYEGNIPQIRRFDRARGSFSEPLSPSVHQAELLAGSSRGDTIFVTGHNSGKIIQFDRSGLRITDVPLRRVFDAVFSPDGEDIIYNSGVHDDRISGVMNINRPGQPRRSQMPLLTTARVHSGNTILSPSGKLILDIRGGGSTILIYDPQTGRLIRELPNGYFGYNQTSGSAAISPDDRRAVYYLSEPPERGGRTVVCYDISTGTKVWARNGFGEDFAAFRYSDDGKEILAVSFVSSSPRLHVVNAETGETTRQHDLPKTEDAARSVFNPSGTEIALPMGETIIIAGVTDGKEIRRFTEPSSQRIATLAYLGNDRLVSTGHDKAIRLWDASRGELLGSVALSVDGKEWAFIHPSGRFEATPQFQEQMYFVQDTTKIPLSAYYEAYHTPGLIGQIMAGETIAAPTIELKDLTQPPKVFLALAGSTRNLTVEDAPEEVTEEQATLRITAQSEQSKISEIRLYHNGKLVESRTRNLIVEDDVPDVETGQAGRTETITVALLPGENTFRAVALNEQRTESAPALLSLDYKPAAAALAGRDGGGMQLHLFVIGVNTYRNPKYNLNYAVPDATAVQDLVQRSAAGIFTKINVTTLFNEKATRAAILESFTTIAQQSGPRDVFVFYFAGHGVMSSDSKSEFFLAPYELTQLYGADDQLRVKAVSSAEVLAASQKISAQKQLFLLDACQSAGALQTVAARGASEEKAVAQLARASGTHWITASGSEQFASEFEKLGHGSFTYVLLEALKGKADNGDGRVTVNELKAYLEAQVPELTKLHKGTPQYPASYGFGQDFPLSILTSP